MKKYLSLVLAAALTAPGMMPAFAGETPAPAAEAAAPAADTPAEDKKICKTFDTLGTRLGKKRVCLTAREWADQEGQARREIERKQVFIDNRGG